MLLVLLVDLYANHPELEKNSSQGCIVLDARFANTYECLSHESFMRQSFISFQIQLSKMMKALRKHICIRNEVESNKSGVTEEL